jgi:VIT1/CCC1 family predicted Fe2+/Mn2+ transporter
MAVSFVTMDTATEAHGQIGGLTLDGNFVFGALVIIVNVKVLTSSYQYTFWSVLLVVLSIGSFFAVFTLFSLLQVLDCYGELSHTYEMI